MSKAQPLDCDDCGRRIGAQGSHLVTGDVVRCIRCFVKRGKHAEVFPDCPHVWHDMHDHPHKWCTRAAAAIVLAPVPAAERLDARRESERERIRLAVMDAAGVEANRDRDVLRACWDARREPTWDGPTRRELTAEAKRELGRKPTKAEARAYAFEVFDAYTIARAWLRVKGAPSWAPVTPELLRTRIAEAREARAASAAFGARFDADFEARHPEHGRILRSLQQRQR